MDYAAAQKRVRVYKSRLTRLQNTGNHHGIINLWAEMNDEFNRNGWPLPDQWHRWHVAAQDAYMELHRRQPLW